MPDPTVTPSISAAPGPVDLDAPAAEPITQQPRGPNGQFAATEQSDTVPAETQPSGDTTEGTEPAQLPPIELPRSWNAEQRERFAALPRETQEYVAERENARDAEVRRAQNDAADKTKALTAKEQAAEQARQQHEAAVAQALQVLDLQGGEFADIKTPADIAKMANDDPFRFVKWQANQQQRDALNNQARQLYETRMREDNERIATWAKQQDDVFADKNKDFADPKKATEIREKIVMPYLTEALGVTPEQLPALWQNPIIRDAKMQQTIFDAARFHAAQKAARAAIPKGQPAPQKPGIAAASGGGSDLASAAAKGDMETYIALRAKGASR